MNTRRTHPKKKYSKKSAKFMYSFFDNGDYVSLKGLEIEDISVNVYEKLLAHFR